MTDTLSQTVAIARRFRRSIRLDTDIDSSDALAGFICHSSGVSVLETMAQLICDSGQRAFTWTGPYGGGKSSLALALAGYVSSDAGVRSVARSLLSQVPRLAKALPASAEDWLVLPVTGSRRDPATAIEAAVTAATGAKPLKKNAANANSLITRLDKEATARPRGGVLLLIDEMGKFLEGAATQGPDVYFWRLYGWLGGVSRPFGHWPAPAMQTTNLC